MPKQIIIAEQHRIAAVFSEDQIQELVVATGSHQVGDIFLGTVENVLPGIDAAFVNIGDSERNGFIHVTDLGPLKLKRSAGSITELLVPQQKVLVQVMKEPTGNKGPRLTGNVTLPGRYLVLMPFGKGVSLSRRIANENERSHLRALAILIKPPGMGLLVRTEAEKVAEEAIIEDLETLQKQWETILQEASSTRAPALLNRDDDFIQRVLRDFYNSDVNRIVVDSHMGMKRVKQNILSWNGGKSGGNVLVEQHPTQESIEQDHVIPILEYFRVNAAIREALKPRVDLPSGGYIIIERTEALTVIDVNSGSFTRSDTARETVLWTNFEAAAEIARQLRLRNIAGVIIVDFIDMDSHRDKLQVLEHFTKALRADKARPQIAQLTELGLVELTRKRQGQNIYELFSRPCATCGGLGNLVHLPGEPENHLEPLERISPRDPSTPELRSNDSRSRDSSSRRRGRSAPPPVYGDPDSLVVDSGVPLPVGISRNKVENARLADEGDEADAGYADRGNRRRRRRRDGGRPPRDNRPEGQLYRNSRPESGDEGSDVAVLEKEEPVTIERVERSDRRSRREGKPSAPPPEQISIVMTPEEQRVYALMGISPLVRLEQSVKDPRSVVISVLSPGEEVDNVDEADDIKHEALLGDDEADQDLELDQDSDDEEDADEITDDSADSADFFEDEDSEDEDGDFSEELDDDGADLSEDPSDEGNSEETTASNDDDENGEAHFSTRRRRRRSSASS